MSRRPSPSRSAGSPGSRRRTAPLGIKIICGLGFLFAPFSIVGSLALMGEVFVVGVVSLGISIGTLVVLYGLWTLQSWAWPWALALYGLNAVANLLTGQLLGAVISIVVAAYILSKEDYYR